MWHVFDIFWWVGLVEAINEVNEDVSVRFMHPHGPSHQFVWPQRDDLCWVPYNKVLCVISPPTTTRRYLYAERVQVLRPTTFQKAAQEFSHLLAQLLMPLSGEKPPWQRLRVKVSAVICSQMSGRP